MKRLLAGSLVAGLAACVSDGVIGPEPGSGSVGQLVGRMPFLAPLLAGAVTSPARELAGGFLVEGRASGRRARSAGGVAGRQARAEMGPRASDALTVATGDDGPPVRIRRLGAGAQRGRAEGGVVVYEGAFPGADALVVSQGEGVEELVVARGPGASASYEVDLPERWRLRAEADAGLVEVLDEAGSARLRVWADRAWDAGGAPVRLALTVEGRRLRAAAPPDVRGPVVIDPVFVGAGTMLAGRREHTATLLGDGSILLAGGAPEGAISAEVYDPRTGRFTATTGAMQTRSGHTATRLQDGRVLLAGGDLDILHGTAEVYDPATGTFTPTTGPLVEARAGHTATRLADGRVLLAGGALPSSLPSAEVYDPATGLFTPTKGDMVMGRADHTATRLDDGRVLLTGGDYYSVSAEVYDPVTGLFAATGPTSEPRERHTATRLGDGRVLLAGGQKGPSPEDTLALMETFDPKTGEFTALASRMVTDRRGHTATLLPDGRVVLAGGSGHAGHVVVPLDTAEVYDPATGQCHPLGSELIAERVGHTATLLDDGRLLVAGGQAPEAAAEAELLEPGDLVASVSHMGEGRYEFTASSLPDGRVLLVGGTVSAGPGDVFDPTTNRFSRTLGSTTEARFFPSATTLGDGSILVAGGQSAVGDLRDSGEVYDPVSGLFAPVTNAMATARSSHTATALASGRVLVAGGFAPSTDRLDEAEIYDPSSRTFAPLTGHLKVARAGHTATRLQDGRVLLAGGDPVGAPDGTAEVYDPTKESFALTAGVMSVYRSSHTATRLGDGRVLLAGGDVTGAQGTAEVYDPATGLFTPTPAPMSTPRDNATATLLADGRVLLAGGDATGPQGTAEVYDPATGLFTPTAGFTSAPRNLHAAARLPDGRVLLAGGLQEGQVLGSAEVYDPETGVFTPLRAGSPTDGRAATETPGGALLLTGGGDGEPPVELSGLSASVVGSGEAARRHHTTTLLPDLTYLLVGGQGADGGALASVATFVSGGGPEPAGELTQARAWHTATRLPDGRVLVAGGEAGGLPLDSFELVVPGASGATKGGKLLSPRTHHAAALLPDGRVLLVGGSNQQGPLGLAEVFDPATGLVAGVGEAPVGADASVGFVGDARLVVSGAARSLRFEPATNAFVELSLEAGSRLATLATGHALGCQERCRFLGERSPTGGNVGSLRLLVGDQLKAVGTGAVGLVGVRDGEGWSGWGSVLEQGAPRPALGALAKDTWLVGEEGSVGGQGWVATGKPGAAPRLDDPQVLAWRPLDGVGPVHLVPVREWGADRVDFTLPRTVYHGPGWLYAVVNGVPGEGVRLTLRAAPAGQACGLGGHCGTGFCVDKLCCDQLCGDSCLACSSEAKGQGADGVCGPIVGGKHARSGCDNPGQTICGFTGACDGSGACVLPGITTVCSDRKDRCQGGVCGPAPGSICDEATNAAVSVGDVLPCGDYLCRDGACPSRCDSHRDCAAGSRCTGEHRCEAAVVLDEVRDPGLLCAASPGPARSGGGGLLVLGLAARWSRRLRRRVALGSAVALAVAPGHAWSEPSAASSAPSAPVPDPAREEARDLLRRGLALYQAGDAQRAAEYFLRSRRLFPAKGNTLNAANALRRVGRLDESLELYEEAVASYATTFDADDQVAVPAAMAELRGQVGSLFVSATTTGALVVDGRERGHLPLAGPIRLLPGEHTVRVIKDGYRTFEATAAVVAGQPSRLDARLEPLAAAGGLRIEAPTLTDAEVLVDGVLVGRTPWEGTLAPGPHVVLSRQGDRGSAPTLATVLQGQTALVRLRADRLGDPWRLAVRPATAELFLDDVPLGKGQWVGALTPGRHVLSASEEGYRTVTRLVSTVEGSDPGGDVGLDLAVDENHPRWPRQPTGTLQAELRLLYGLGYGLAGDAARGCASSSCQRRGLLNGPGVSLGVSYEFPFRLSVEALLGDLSLEQRQRRTVARRLSGDADPGGVYRIDDLLRLKGAWLGVGAGYRWPVSARWSLRARLLAGVLFGRSSDSVTGALDTVTGQSRVAQDRAGQQVASTPLFLLPEVSAVATVGEWRLLASVGVWATLMTGPTLPNGDLRVSPDCPASGAATAPGCAGDSTQLAGERAYRAFALVLPGLGLARVF